MTRVLMSETRSGVSAALALKLKALGLTVLAQDGTAPGVPEDCAALVVTDLAEALMVRPVAEAESSEPLSEADLTRIEGLIASASSGTARVVLLSIPLSDAALATGLARAAKRLEAAIATKLPGRAVILRASDIIDPTDLRLRTAVQGLIDGSLAVWPAGDQLQAIALSDLTAALAASVQARSVLGNWYDIVHPEAVSRPALLSEVQRIAKLLVDTRSTEIQARPAYPAVSPRRDGTPGATALHVSPRKSIYVLMAETIQGMTKAAAEAGKIEPLRPPMPAIHRALETGSLPLAGRQVVLTGATGSIGQAVARMLVRLGAHVIGIGRTAEKGAAMERDLASEHAFLVRQRTRLDAARAAREGTAPIPGDPGTFRFVQADLADLEALRALAGQLQASCERIDVLIHAAGATYPTRRETPQFVEATLAVNLIAPITLTRLLAEPLRKAGRGGGAWVLTLVSDKSASLPFDLTDLQSRLSYLPEEVLFRAHSGLVAMTGALAEAMRGSGVSIAAVSLAPVRSDLFTPLEEPVTGGATAKQVQQTQRDKARMQMATPGHGAAQVLEVLVSADFVAAHGGLVRGEELVGSALAATEDRSSVAALWKACAELAGLPE